MMGQLNRDQGQLFYCFNLEEVVPGDHLVRAIAAVLDLSWVRAELAAHYSPMGRPSIDPLLMIRMLIVVYVFAIRSERALCREVQVNLPIAGSAASAALCAALAKRPRGRDRGRKPKVQGVSVRPTRKPAMLCAPAILSRKAARRLPRR